MTDVPTFQAPPEPPPAAPASSPASPDAAPPWGEEENFNPERAWKLIQDLRSESRVNPSELEQLRAAQTRLQELEQANMTELQREQDRATQAERQAQEARDETVRLRMAVKYRLDDADLDLLGSGTETVIEARAKRLAERAAASPGGVPSFDGGAQTTAPTADMNAAIRRAAGR